MLISLIFVVVGWVSASASSVVLRRLWDNDVVESVGNIRLAMEFDCLASVNSSRSASLDDIMWRICDYSSFTKGVGGVCWVDPHRIHGVTKIRKSTLLFCSKIFARIVYLIWDIHWITHVLTSFYYAPTNLFGGIIIYHCPVRPDHFILVRAMGWSAGTGSEILVRVMGSSAGTSLE